MKASHQQPFIGLAAVSDPHHGLGHHHLHGHSDHDIVENLPGKPALSKTKSGGPQALFFSLVAAAKRKETEKKLREKEERRQ